MKVLVKIEENEKCERINTTILKIKISIIWIPLLHIYIYIYIYIEKDLNNLLSSLRI